MAEPFGRLTAALAGRYAIEHELGRGGMAVVYLARDLKHDRLVAIKVLRPELGAAIGSERFAREIRVLARLQHPHILPLLDSGTVGAEGNASTPYYVMPFVEGESLGDRLHRERRLPLEEALRLAHSIAGALAYAHAHGVVHRDIKPENILLSGGQPMLADFGIARALSVAGGERLTETGLALGTPQYMCPEQAAGTRSVDARADVYALGCVLYEMVSGEPPYSGPTAQAVITKHLTEPVPPLRTTGEVVPEGVARAVATALAKTPDERFPTIETFARTLSNAMRPAPSARGRRTLPWWAAAGIVAVAGAALGIRAWRSGAEVSGSASTSVMAVLPFRPSGEDTALSRLGRDLVFTLSAELDGLGDTRTVDPHTVLAQTHEDGPTTRAEGAALARRLGAGSSIQGSLVREGDFVRLDVVVLSTDSLAGPLARGFVTGQPDSVAALSDSIARLLLRQLWARGAAPTPSLDAVLRTRSVPALRAFLTGEGHIVNNQWDSATMAYAEAIEADSTFWLAYARLAYTKTWSLMQSPSSVLSPLEAHLRELPDRERLVSESVLFQAREEVQKALDSARVATDRFGDSWLIWLVYGDELLHNGALVGLPPSAARQALQRAVELNPTLIPGWEHLTLLMLLDGDTAAARHGIEELQRIGAGPALTADGFGNRLVQFRYLAALVGGDSALVRTLTDSLVRDPAPSAVAFGSSFYDPYRYGFFDEQIRVSRAALDYWQTPDRQANQFRLIARAWAARGAWDSALVNMDSVAERGARAADPLRAYGLAVVGAWLGAVDAREAARRRPAAVTVARSDSGRRGELAWLDGLVAVTRRDPRGLAAAIADVKAREGASSAAARSLAAFATALGGSTSQAGASMAALEWEEAAIGAPGFAAHPYTIAVDRLAAARWLAAAGDTDQAARLLIWVDGPFLLHESAAYTIPLTPLITLERARIEERRGNATLAGVYYRDFLRHYDRAVPTHQHLVDEAQTALARLATTAD